MGEVAQGNARLFSYRGGTLARRASPAASTKRFEAARNRARAHLAAAACGNACRRNCQGGTRAIRGLHRYWKSRELAAPGDTACDDREYLAPRPTVGSMSCSAGYRSSCTTPQEPDGLV